MTLRRQLAVLIMTGVLLGAASAQSPEQIEEAEKQLKDAQDKSDWAAVLQTGIALDSMIDKALAATKPETTTDEFWKNSQDRLKAEKAQAEYACLDATNKETDPAKRIKLLEQYIKAFDGREYAKRSLPTLAGLYQQTGDTANALTTAKKVLETDPDNEGMHIMLADNDLAKKQLPSAIEHAKAAVKILQTKTKPEGYTDDAWAKYVKIISGSGHAIAGQALMQQGKSEAAIPELKAASDQLAGNQQALGPVLYNLGFAYAKLARPADARAVLARGAQIPGPFQQLSKDLLAQQTPKGR